MTKKKKKKIFPLVKKRALFRPFNKFCSTNDLKKDCLILGKEKKKRGKRKSNSSIVDGTA